MTTLRSGRSHRPLRVAALAVAAGSIAAACGAGSDDTVAVTDAPQAAPATDASTSGATETPTSDAAASPAGEAPEILRFTNALVGGGQLDAATLADKPTAFWFWAPT